MSETITITLHSDPADIVSTWNSIAGSGYVDLMLDAHGQLHAFPIGWQEHVQRANGMA